jgi:peptidyl-tRNA hydrolase
MNLSGKAVESFLAKNRSLFNSKDPTNDKPKSLQQILKDYFIIAHDDLEHKFGNIRIKQKGSA